MREEGEMKRREDGNEGDGGVGDLDCKRPTNPAACNGVAARLVDDIFACRHGDLFDDDGDPRWGTRHPDECALDFLGGDARASFLGDGEDLP